MCVCGGVVPVYSEGTKSVYLRRWGMQASAAPRSAFEGMTGEHADFKVPQEGFMDRKKMI